MNILLTSKGSSTGNALVTGLPFTVGSAGSWSMGGASPYYTSFAAAVASGLAGYAAGNTTTVQLTTNAAGGITNLDDTSFTNTSAFLLTVTYFV